MQITVTRDGLINVYREIPCPACKETICVQDYYEEFVALEKVHLKFRAEVNNMFEEFGRTTSYLLRQHLIEKLKEIKGMKGEV